jgi:S-formylglutathione hydrolase
MKLEKQHICYGGTISYYSHESAETKTPMRFSLFLPPQSEQSAVPYMVFLSGLTCTEDNFTTKACAYKTAADLGMAILAPDTSPRREDVADDEAYDLGQGAGFYLDATQDPWAENFRMESYIIKELIPMVENAFPINAERKSICGHSMGGHGALTLYFKYPELFKSCSAFSPIVAPSQVPWGHKAFAAYLGDDQEQWTKHDACELVKTTSNAAANAEILIDQGLDDQFLEEQLKPELFEEACQAAGQKLTLRKHDGYDHSYFFIQSFIDDHLRWHHKA